MNRDISIRAVGSGGEAVVSGGEERRLLDSWDEACLPLHDDRPEVVAWYEERRMEARNALIEYRRRQQENRLH
jgi:hypothetical protein